MILENKYTMRFISLFIISAFTLLGCGSNEENIPQIPDEWNLIFEEEFNDDLSSWDAWFGGAFNEEIQLYRPEQLSINNGVLTINVQRENASGPTTIFDATEKNFEFVSGRIQSNELFGPSDVDGEREYRFVSRIKLPAGNGMWPAFWTFGNPWPTQGEIDILEARGNRPMEFQSNIFYGPTANENINEGADVLHSIGTDLTAEYHTYEMIWKANSIEILFDGDLIHTYFSNSRNNINSFFGKKQKVVLNVAVGGVFFNDKDPNNYADNSEMEIDWVRVYKR